MTRRKQQPSKHDSNNNQDGVTVIGDKSFDALWSETLASMRRESPEELRAVGWRATVDLLPSLGIASPRQADRVLFGQVNAGKLEHRKGVLAGRVSNFWRPLKK